VVVAGNEPEGEASAASTGGPGPPTEPPTPAGGQSPTAAADPAARHPAQPEPEPEQSLAEVARARRRRAAKAVGALVVFIVLVLFIVANSQPVEVNFLFFKANPRLIWEMVTCAVLGGVLGYMLGRPGREGKAKKKDGGGPPAR
jgi:uncharacterized integral membrane protein